MLSDDMTKGSAPPFLRPGRCPSPVMSMAQPMFQQEEWKMCTCA